MIECENQFWILWTPRREQHDVLWCYCNNVDICKVIANTPPTECYRSSFLSVFLRIILRSEEFFLKIGSLWCGSTISKYHNVKDSWKFWGILVMLISTRPALYVTLEISICKTMENLFTRNDQTIWQYVVCELLLF